MEPDPAVPGYAPSSIVHPSYKGKGEAPHEMTKDDIREVVAAYARSAGHARRLGFDGAEIHGAHGYLIDQFFWEATNQRTDEYGGTFEKRLRFGIEVIEACRGAVPKDFPIVLRFSQWKQGGYDWKIAKTPQELEKFLLPLSKAGVDVFHASTRRYWESEFEGLDLNLAGWTKKITGKPTITVGSVGLDTDFIKAFATQAKNAPLDNLLERMARDEFDLVAVGRALLADPEWAEKVRAHREAEIKPFTPQAVGVLW